MPAHTVWPVRLPGRRPPDAVRSVAVPDGDRRLGWALTTAGDPVVATVRGLILPGRALVAWADLERASWLRPLLTVVELAPGDPAVSGTGRRTVLQIAEDEADLPDIVRTAVTSSVAWTTHVRLQPAGGARIVARRRPGQDQLDWQVVYDPGTDLADPAVRIQAEAVRDRSRRSLG